MYIYVIEINFVNFDDYNKQEQCCKHYRPRNSGDNSYPFCYNSAVEIKKVIFNRNNLGQIVFDTRNLELLKKYVIPIIEKNKGWSSEHITSSDFFKNPEKYRVDIDATVESDKNAEVFIALDNNLPVGLLEYVAEDLNNLDSSEFQNILNNLRENKNSTYWKQLVNLEVIDTNSVETYFSKLNSFLEGKKLYKFVGVVLKPELQGKKSGISDALYKTMKTGFIQGWTSTPLVVAKRKKVYSATVLFPRFGERPNNLEEFACIALASARVISKEIPQGFSFGVKTLESFALRNKKEYMKLAYSFLQAGKISELDYKRLDYTLDFERGQALIMSYTS